MTLFCDVQHEMMGIVLWDRNVSHFRSGVVERALCGYIDFLFELLLRAGISFLETGNEPHSLLHVILRSIIPVITSNSGG